MKYFLKSIFFFFSIAFRKIKVDVVFYYPQHFNRGKDGENVFFSDLINTCKTNKISYLVFEEVDYKSNAIRSEKYIPFDFLILFIRFIRRFYIFEQNVIKKDQKIGSIINKILFNRLSFNNVITISQSMVSFFRGLNPTCEIFDVQHGIIHNNKENYIIDNKVESNILENNVHLLLNGQSFQDILAKNDDSSYFKSHSTVIGSSTKSIIFHKKSNNNILVTLQFTSDHDQETNKLLYKHLINFISSQENDINFYLKQHPRFNNEVCLFDIFELPNVHLAPKEMNECFQLCSLHATAYSTSVFEAALCGIPSILINPLQRFDYFKTDFRHPIQCSVDDFREEKCYQECSQLVRDWASSYYYNYDEKKLLNLLR